MIPSDVPIETLLRSLRERAKELNCLYRIEESLKDRERPLGEIIADVVAAIPGGMQYPGITRVRIVYGGEEYLTPDFRESPWLLSAPILAHMQRIGTVDVYYTERVTAEVEGSFLQEEHRLISSVADRIGYFIERSQFEGAYQRARGEGAAAPAARPQWRVIVDFIRRTDEDLLRRLSRKLLNHLCWTGAREAADLLHSMQPTENLTDRQGADENQPLQVRTTGDSLSLADEVFSIASIHMTDDEILAVIQSWIREDNARSLVHTIGNPDSPMDEVTEALARYHHSGPERIELSPATEKGLRVSLIEHFFTTEIKFINTAKRFMDLDDFYHLSQQILSRPGSFGKLGGKSAGLFLACNIVRKSALSDPTIGTIKTPRTWYITSDGLLKFIQFNNLEEVYNQKYVEIDHIRSDYPHLVQVFKNSTFPPEMVKGLSAILDSFGDHPLIVRSSSLLEDRFGSAFSGKYKSLFLANQGSKNDRLIRLMDAIAEIYASTFAPDPIEYRTERGLIDVYEEMGIMIQEVVGARVGDYFFPSFAGVAFSNNEFRWSARIRREDGLVRLVPGLGTRAVDRVKDDYPVLLAPGQPGLRVNVSLDEVIRYSPKMIDVINLKSGAFETIPLAELIASCGSSYPGLRNIVSLIEDGQLRRLSTFGVDFEKGSFVATFDGLVGSTPFVKQIHAVIGLLKREMGTPVDIEFAHDGQDLYLLQCRPQSYAGITRPSPIPRDIDEKRVLFTGNRFISNGRVPDVTHIVYIDHNGYQSLATLDDLKAVGQTVGRLNKVLPKRQFILMGPGRWGSRGDIKLGVNVTYADISNTAVLIEIARRKQNYLPDLSFGTHFFQDLVESSIRYIPLYPDDPGNLFNETFLLESENMLAELLPDAADLSGTIRVIDVPRAAGGQVLHVLMNAEEEMAVALFSPPSVATEDEGASVPSEGRREDDHWRWRMRFAERIAAELDAERYGVKGIWVFGSTKNATAGPASDIDLIVHFEGTKEQRRCLDSWLQGWSLALAEMNYLRTGYRAPQGLLDLHILTKQDFDRRTSFALKVGAVTDPARKLMTKGSVQEPA